MNVRRGESRSAWPRMAFALAGALPSVVVVLLATSSTRLDALPQYSARSARTCDNCHTDPTNWTNPPFFDRQCSMDCSVCHVDPTGGGLRTVSGTFYGLQTLSLFGSTRKPWQDRLLLSGAPPEPPDYRYGQAGPTSVPTSQPTSRPTGEATDTPHDDEPGLGVATFGTPLGGSSEWAWEQGRYGALDADPLLRLGGDLRLAFYFVEGGMTFFPMQADVAAAVHPVEHLTFYVEGGAQGSLRGLGNDTVVAGDEASRFGLHEVFVMTHEWPANTYVKVGRFLPPFGWRLDDHTAPTRRELGFDQGRPSSFVSGIEVGAVANYPYLNVAAFKLDAGQSGFWPDNGEGFSATTGWRDLWWGAGASFYRSSSALETRTMAGLVWYLNPWRWWENVPLTYLGELDFVDLDRPDRARRVQQLAAFHELDWRFRPGAQLRVRYDFFDEDLEVAEDAYHRLNFGVDFFPFLYTELQTVGRVYFPEIGGAYADLLVNLRVWY